MKSKIVGLFVIGIIASIGFLGVPAHATGSNATVVTEYALFDDLTVVEQDQVIPEQPSIVIQHDNETIKLVYINTSNKTVSQVSHPHNSGDLPRAGEKNQTMSWLIGLFVATLTIGLFILKRKEAKAFMLLVILATGIGPARIVEAIETNLPATVNQKLAKNGAIYSPTVTVANYEYVGYIHSYSDKEQMEQKGTVTVNYQDTEGNTLAETETLTGIVGTQYQIEGKELVGYQLNHVEGDQTGNYTGENQVVTFIYSQNLGTIEVNVSTAAVDEGVVIMKDDGDVEFVKPIGYVLASNHSVKLNLSEMVSGPIGSAFDMNFMFPYPKESGQLMIALDVIYNDGVTNQTGYGNGLYIKLEENETIPSMFTETQQKIQYSVVLAPSGISDYRLKKDIHKIDTIKGINIYLFKYKADPTNTVFVGTIAQELEEKYPFALIKDEYGYYKVNYAALGLRMVTLEQYIRNPLSIVIF